MIVFLYGPDDYRRLQKKKSIIAEFCKKHSALGIERFDVGEEGEVVRLREYLGNQSIFESAKLAVLDRCFEGAEVLPTELMRIVAHPTTTAIISENDKPAKPFNFLLKHPVICQEFKHLEGAEWKSFIGSEARRCGAQLSPPALSYLATAYANDTWRLMTELHKLAAFHSVVDRSDLERLSIELSPVFWDILRGLRGRTVGERLLALEKSLDTNEPAAKTFNILSAQWPERLGAIASFDLKVKSGKLDYEEALVDLLIS